MTNDEAASPSFGVGGGVDYTQSSSMADLACRWAEQRRLALEVRAKTAMSAVCWTTIYSGGNATSLIY